MSMYINDEVMYGLLIMLFMVGIIDSILKTGMNKIILLMFIIQIIIINVINIYNNLAKSEEISES